MNPIHRLLLAAGLSAGLAISAAAQNLIVNGDFETGTAPAGQTTMTIPYWTVTAPVDWVPAGKPYWPNNSSQWVDLTGVVGSGSIEQTFATEVGATYSVSFRVFNGSLVYSLIGAVTNPVLSVTVAGVLQTVVVAPGTESTVSLSFTATGTTTTLRFSDITGTDSNGGWIDDVSVVKTASAPVIDYPAAPAIANQYLQGLGLKPNSTTFKNYVSLVAGHMAQGAKFEGLAPSDSGYATAVINWMNKQFGLPKK